MADEQYEQLGISFAEKLETRDPEAPAFFPLFDESIETNTSCPSCGYQWNDGDGESEGLTPDDMPHVLMRCPKCGCSFEDDQQGHDFEAEE